MLETAHGRRLETAPRGATVLTAEGLSRHKRTVLQMATFLHHELPIRRAPSRAAAPFESAPPCTSSVENRCVSAQGGAQVTPQPAARLAHRARELDNMPEGLYQMPSIQVRQTPCRPRSPF